MAVLCHKVIVARHVVAKVTEQAIYIAGQSSQAIAERYVDGLFDYFNTLDIFPERGHPRADILPGLTIIGHRGANIAVVIERLCVYVVGAYFGGEDYESELHALNIETIKRDADAESARMA